MDSVCKIICEIPFLNYLGPLRLLREAITTVSIGSDDNVHFMDAFIKT